MMAMSFPCQKSVGQVANLSHRFPSLQGSAGNIEIPCACEAVKH